MGIVSKAVAKSADVKAEVYFAELNWNAIMSLALGRNVTYAPLPKTQPVKRDLALLIDSSVTMEQIEQVVRKSEKRLLRSVEPLRRVRRQESPRRQKVLRHIHCPARR